MTTPAKEHEIFQYPIRKYLQVYISIAVISNDINIFEEQTEMA